MLLVLFHVVALVLCCCFGLLVWFYVVGLVLCCWFSCWFCDWFGFMLLVWFSLVGFVLFCCSLFLFVIEFCVVGFGLVYSRWCCLSLMLKKVVSVLITIRVSCFPGTEYEQIQSYHWKQTKTNVHKTWINNYINYANVVDFLYKIWISQMRKCEKSKYFYSLCFPLNMIRGSGKTNNRLNSR